jgi:hypothetical protein
MNDFMTDTDTEMDKGWMTFTDEEWKDMTQDWETVEDQNGISNTEEEDMGRETYQEQGAEAYGDLPYIRKINWDLPE